MKSTITSLPDRLKQSMKHFVEELKERDDYEVRMSEQSCNNCGGKAKIPQFRFFGYQEWRSAYKNREIICKVCNDEKELARILEKNKFYWREQLNDYFDKEYCYIPDDLMNAGFKNFQVGCGNVLEAKKQAMDYVKKFTVIDQKDRYNLLIMGNPGTGKTHLATTIARTLKKKGFLIGQLTTGKLLSKIKSTYQNGASQTEEGIFKDLRKIDLLVLDDLGSEARSKDEFDWSKNKLFEIVNLRIGKPTIYTSNFNQEHLPTAIGERVFSRLYNNTKFIELVAEDYRKNFRIK